MEKPKHVIFTIHGIRTEKDKGNWQDEFQNFTYLQSVDIDVFNYKYGYWCLLPYISSGCHLPLLGLLSKPLRNFYAYKFKAFIKKRLVDYPADTQVHIVAHSFGTWITHELMLDASLPINSVHLLAGVVSAHIENNQFDVALKTRETDRVYVWCSKKDLVCRFAPFPFGHLGYWGLIDGREPLDQVKPRVQPYPDLRAFNRPTIFDHSGYFNNETFSQILQDVLS